MSQANIDLVQDLYGAFGRADVPAILGNLAEDVTWEAVGRPSDFPTFGPRAGVPAVLDFFVKVGENEDFTEFLPQSLHASGDKVFVLGHAKYKAKKTGKPVVTDWVHVFTLRDGKVSGWLEFADTAQIAEAYRG